MLRIESLNSGRNAGGILNRQTGNRVGVMEPRVIHLWIYSVCLCRRPIRRKLGTGLRGRLCVFCPTQFIVRDDSRVVMHRLDFPASVLLDVGVLEDAFL